MDLKCLLEEGRGDHFKSFSIVNEGFPGGTCGKDFACQFRDTRDAVSIPGLGRSPGKGNGNPLQYSCLNNHMERGARWVYSPQGRKSRTQPSMHYYYMVNE